jgi:arylsulfatase A-like enzyme
MPQPVRPPRGPFPATLVGAVLGAVLLTGSCGGGPDGRPRNVILISLDTLRPDHMSCYGHERETTPNLDRKVAGGALFTDVTSVAPWTLPAHATMLTGLYPSHHGLKDHDARLSDKHVTLAEEFRDAGYETLAVVNTHNVGAPQFQMLQGFEKSFYVQEIEVNPGGVGKTKQRTFNSGPSVVSTAKDYLRDNDRPFFLFLHFYDAHTDFTPKEEFFDRFVEPYSGRMTGHTGQLAGIRARGEGPTLTEEDLRFLRQMYDAEICQLDDLLGRFFEWLDEEGLAQDTLFVVTSDHGEEFVEHGSVLHGTTQYEELLDIPLLMWGPGVPSGTVIDAPVSTIDIVPTILGMMDLPSRETRDGVDVSVLWKGGSLPERLLFGEADHNNVVDRQEVTDIRHMVREGSLKLHHNTATGQYELYDIDSDAGEQSDRSESRAQDVERLRLALEDFRATAVEPEPVGAEMSAADREKLDALGYGGGGEDE